MKTIAFYLPQFHEFPENNEWWGKGFTEWRNMKNATPLYKNHYQPRIPQNKNYYDLTDINTIKWQAELAKKNGIYGFCFYHYWFSGKLLMEKPLELFLSDKNIDINFCFSWANETWTRAWASKEDEILIEQKYGNEAEWISHFNYFLPFFKDERYIKIDNKPLLVIYRPEKIECIKLMIDCWSKMARQSGFDGICLYYQQYAFSQSKSDSKKLFEGAIEYEPAYYFNSYKKQKSMLGSYVTECLKKIKIINRFYKEYKLFPTVYSYDDIWNYILTKSFSSESIPCALVGWDNTPRRRSKGSVIEGGNPEKFKKYFHELVLRTKKEYNKDFIFIFAWNEWAEGGYLEPDEKFGDGYLRAIRDVLIELDEFPNNIENI